MASNGVKLITTIGGQLVTLNPVTTIIATVVPVTTDSSSTLQESVSSASASLSVESSYTSPTTSDAATLTSSLKLTSSTLSKSIIQASSTAVSTSTHFSIEPHSSSLEGAVGSGSSKTGMIVGLSIGIPLFLLVVAGLCYFFYQKQQRRDINTRYFDKRDEFDSSSEDDDDDMNKNKWNIFNFFKKEKNFNYDESNCKSVNPLYDVAGGNGNNRASTFNNQQAAYSKNGFIASNEDSYVKKFKVIRNTDQMQREKYMNPTFESPNKRFSDWKRHIVTPYKNSVFEPKQEKEQSPNTTSEEQESDNSDPREESLLVVNKSMDTFSSDNYKRVANTRHNTKFHSPLFKTVDTTPVKNIPSDCAENANDSSNTKETIDIIIEPKNTYKPEKGSYRDEYGIERMLYKPPPNIIHINSELSSMDSLQNQKSNSYNNTNKNSNKNHHKGEEDEEKKKWSYSSPLSRWFLRDSTYFDESDNQEPSGNNGDLDGTGSLSVELKSLHLFNHTFSHQNNSTDGHTQEKAKKKFQTQYQKFANRNNNNVNSNEKTKRYNFNHIIDIA